MLGMSRAGFDALGKGLDAASGGLNKEVRSAENVSTDRLFLLDFLKALSIVAVVSFHATFVPRAYYSSSAMAVDVLFAPLRFCVPVLLVISFFLLARSVERSSRSWKHLVRRKLARLLLPTVFWFSLGALKMFAQGKSIGQVMGAIAIGEAFTGAYYLVILYQLMPVGIWLMRKVLVVERLSLARSERVWPEKMRRDRWQKGLLACACGVHAGVMLSFYMVASSASWIERVSALGRVPGVYWMGYVLLGLWVYRGLPVLVDYSKRLAFLTKAALLTVLAVAFWTEYHALSSWRGGLVVPFEYMLVSCFLSAPIIVLCAGNVQAANFPGWAQKWFVLLSRYSLGIFCINGILSEIFLAIGSRLAAGMSFGYWQVLMLRVVGWGILLLVSLAIARRLEKLGLKQVVC